ncbi:hypothetical protein XENE109146_14690 [Xenorhabdus nematophila]
MQPGVALFKAGDAATETALFFAVLRNGERRTAIEDRREVNCRISACQPHVEGKEPGEPFVQRKIGDNERLWRQAACRQGKSQAARC